MKIKKPETKIRKWQLILKKGYIMLRCGGTVTFVGHMLKIQKIQIH